MKKMIVSDLDGTLLRNDKTVSAYTVEVLKEIETMGIPVVFATARPPRDAFRLIPDELKNDFVSCYNGALVYHGPDVIYKKELSRQTVLDIATVAEQFGFGNICIEVNDQLFSNFDVSCVFGESPFTFVDLSVFSFFGSFKVMIYAAERISTSFLAALPAGCRGVITDDGTLCQIMHDEVTKWNSIDFLIHDYHGVRADVIAFGDDFNDMEMIENSGIGVAMGNAVDELKAVADHVTASNDEDGVATFLHAFFSKG